MSQSGVKELHSLETIFDVPLFQIISVRGGCRTDMPSARHRKRHGEDVNMVLEVNDEGFQNLMSTSTSLRQEECNSSRKHTRSSSLHSRSPFFSQDPVYEHEGHCLFKEEFSLPKINSQLGSAFGSFGKDQNLGGDLFSLYTGTDFCRSKCSFRGSEKDTPIEFTSENFDARQPFRSRKSFNSSFILKSAFGDTLLDARDLEVHVQSSCPPETYGDIESPLSPELSAQESVTENVENCSKSKATCPEQLIQVSTEIKNVPSERRLPTQETIVKDYAGSRKLANNGISQEISAHAVEANVEETSLSIKLTHDSDEELKTPTESVETLHMIYLSNFYYCLSIYFKICSDLQNSSYELCSNSSDLLSDCKAVWLLCVNRRSKVLISYHCSDSNSSSFSLDLFVISFCG